MLYRAIVSISTLLFVLMNLSLLFLSYVKRKYTLIETYTYVYYYYIGSIIFISLYQTTSIVYESELCLSSIDFFYVCRYITNDKIQGRVGWGLIDSCTKGSHLFFWLFDNITAKWNFLFLVLAATIFLFQN